MLHWLLDLYSLVLLAAVLLSWVDLPPDNPFVRVVRQLTEPVLQPIRRLLPSTELVERLSAAAPHDRADVELATYRGLVPPWNDWQHVTMRGRHWASLLATLVLGSPG